MKQPPTTADRTRVRRDDRAHFVGILGVLLFATPPFALVAQSFEDFYSQREASGRSAAARGDYRSAAQELEIAAFGQLEDPPALAGTLVRLSLAQLHLDRSADFLETAIRVVSLEDRFGAYRAAPLLAEERELFEQSLVERNVPLAATRMAEVLEERRRANEAQEAADFDHSTPPGTDDPSPEPAPAAPNPEQLRSRFETLALEGKQRKASAAARELVAVEDGADDARCYLAATQRSSEGTCAAALESLEQCIEPSAGAVRERVVEATLECQQRLERWQDAVDVLALLDQQELSRLGRRVEKIRQRHQREMQRAAEEAARQASADEVHSAGIDDSSAQTDDQGTSSLVATDSTSQTSADPTPSAVDGAIESPGSAQIAPTQDAEAASVSNRDEIAGPSGTDPLTVATRPVPAQPAEAAEPTESSPLDDRVGVLLQLASQAQTIEDLDPLLAESIEIANDSGDPRADLAAGSLAYRAGRWATAIRHLTRHGDPRPPEALFYLSVSLYEVGYRQAARSALLSALPGLERTDFVERRARQILGSDNP